MKKLLVAGLVLACASIGVVRAQAMQGDDHAQIVALEQHFIAAFRVKDIDAIMKVYQPGSNLFVFDVGPPREHVGSADYRKDWHDFFALFKGEPKSVEISELTVVNDGTLGFGHSIQRVTGTSTDGKPLDFTVRVTDGYQKIGGTWYIVQEHVSIPVDFVTDKGDIHSKP